MEPRLFTKYKKEIVPALQQQFKYENIMQIPKVKKVIIHVGTGTKSNYDIDAVTDNLGKITGQAPVKTLAKKSISNFKIREGMTIGAKVTLRGPRMYEFLDRLVNITFPRVQDFRGLPSKGFDKNGNYSIGLKDQMPFPEIKAESIEQLHGVQITINTTAKTKEEGYQLLKGLGMPIQELKK